MPKATKSARLMKRTVDAARPADKRYVVWDTELRGFGLRVEPSGIKSYIARYRVGGGRGAPLRQMFIGRHGELTAEEARKTAAPILSAARDGKDPLEARREKRSGIRLDELAKRFLVEYAEAKRKPSTAAYYRWLLTTYLVPKFGRRQADAITRAELARLHLDLSSSPYLANRMLAITGSMYAWGAKHGLVAEGANPARGIEKFTEDRRERFLSLEELERLGAAIREAETVGIPWQLDEAKPQSRHLPKPDNRRTKIAPSAAAALRLLIFTGARLREILTLKWEHVDFERGLLVLPDSKSGRKTIVLNAPALAVLNSLPREGVYVIPGKPADEADENSEEKPRADLKRPWALVQRRAKLTGVRIHDLRHTFASYGAGANMGLPVIGKLLGHSQPATTARYAHLQADPLRLASESIASQIAAAMGETRTQDDADNVVPIERGGAA